MNSVERAGSSPAASQSVATSSTFSRIGRGVGVVGGERVPVHDREEALVAVLQARPSCRGRPCSCRGAAAPVGRMPERMRGRVMVIVAASRVALRARVDRGRWRWRARGREDRPEDPGREQDEQDPLPVGLDDAVVARPRRARQAPRGDPEPSSGGSGTRLKRASRTFICTPVFRSAMTGSVPQRPRSAAPTKSAGGEQQREQQVRDGPGRRPRARGRAARSPEVLRRRRASASPSRAAARRRQKIWSSGMRTVPDRVDVGERVEA